MRWIIYVLLVLVTGGYAANEITTSVTLSADKGYLSVNKSVQGLKTTMTGTDFEQKTTTFTNSSALTISVASPGMAFFRNLSTNESALITLVLKLAPGQFAQGPLGSNVVTIAPVSTNAVVVESIILSE